MAEALSTADLRKTARLLRKHGGDRPAVCRELGIQPRSLRARIESIRIRLPDEKFPTKHGTPPPVPPEKIREAVELVELHGSVTKASRVTGKPFSTIQKYIRESETRTDWKPQGRTKALTAKKLPLPKGDDIARYILTCAQSGTKLHEPTWDALNALANHYGARLLVSTFSYSHRQEGTAKRGTGGGDAGVDWYDPRIEPFVADDMVAAAPSLIFNGHMNILPTASDPLSGMDNYNGRHSSIFPHAKQHMRSIATTADAPAKLQYTTGACTQLNYLQKKAGQKAEFDHVFGGLLVEVNSKGEWWARQLITDSKGRIYDLDVVATKDGVASSAGCAALIFGDLHTAHLDPDTVASRWADGGMVDALRPAVQVAHDILDMESRGHHNRRDPHKMFELHVRGRENVAQEVAGVRDLLGVMARHSKVVVANSNHDRHLERWLKEADWRNDPVNAEFYVDCQKAYLAAVRAGKRFDALAWAVGKQKGVRFLAPGESFVVCRDGSGGVELGLHGDLGPAGARGSVRNLSRIGRRTVIGHSHSAGIYNGCWQVGLTAPMSSFDYARGAPGSWSHSDCLVHVNGKRQMLTWWRGKWRA